MERGRAVYLSGTLLLSSGGLVSVGYPLIASVTQQCAKVLIHWFPRFSLSAKRMIRIRDVMRWAAKLLDLAPSNYSASPIPGSRSAWGSLRSLLPLLWPLLASAQELCGIIAPPPLWKEPALVLCDQNLQRWQH